MVVYIKAFCLGLAFFQGNLLADEIIKSDKALFTVEKRVFFHSDVVRYVGSLKIMNCIYSDSFLLLAAKIDINSSKNIYQGKFSKDLLERLVKVVKLATFADSQVSLDYDVMWKEIGHQRCLKNGPAGWSHDLKVMFLAEIFLKERFKKKVKESGSESIALFGESVGKKYKHHVFD